MTDPAMQLRIVPPLEDGAWVLITPALLYAWKLSAEQDRKREVERQRARTPAARPTNWSAVA